MPTVTRGLHAVRHLVIEPTTGTVIGAGDDKLQALAAARKVLRATEALARVEAQARVQLEGQGLLFHPDELAQPPVRERARPVSKRRRDVHAKCDGRCHYCGKVLALDGSWHVEHALPRALGGLDEISNLFAACAPCNLAKRDRTALEFVAAELRRIAKGGSNG
ncbi:HNH endonuclease [Rhizobacter sp. SG703]|uniref:HNH endonuclease n=1 Tax=Rhizobacter sp. SG703 TaxID=2587140 RepID=UPI0014479929|nr:HNH endonuclease [Rhizobacter sp. SG703]